MPISPTGGSGNLVPSITQKITVTKITVTINVTDITTGLPANGGNLQVVVRQTIAGNTYDVAYAVPGQSLQIYFGSYQDGMSWYIVSYSSSSDPTPTGGSCDLKIINVQPIAETGVGAANGSAVIDATSSNGPIQYSLDNSTWKDSNQFNGLISGAKTAYVKDGLGCTAQLPFTVPLLSNVLVSDPAVNLGGNNISRWNAAFNNIFFTFQRTDFEISSIVTDPAGSGNILVNVNADVSTVVPQGSITINGNTTYYDGDYVYIKTANYAGVFMVLSVADTGLVLNCPYVDDDGAGFININRLRPGYQIQCIITYVDTITNVLMDITVSGQPLPDGSLMLDLQYFLQMLLKPVSLSQYNVLNYRDMQLSASYQVKYAEVWTNNSPVWTTMPNPYYVVYSAMQLQEKGGGNLQEYVPYPQGFQPAKWLTDFEQPVYSNGFPYDLSFIFSEYMAGLSPYYVITLLDINYQPLEDQSVDDAYLLDESGDFLLNQDGSKFIIASQSVSKTPIAERVGLNRLLINFTPPETCAYFKVQLFYDTETTFALTKPITVRVDDGPASNPVYLRWIGMKGTWEYYRFFFNQDVGLDVSTALQVKNYISDWYGSETIENVIQKSAAGNMTVYAENVPVQEMIGCRGIKTSTMVQIYMPSTQRWQTVIVATGSYDEYSTQEGYGDISLKFSLASYNLQTQ